jgi:acetyltransferase-like isoleucine patch superfamily enzyme
MIRRIARGLIRRLRDARTPAPQTLYKIGKVKYHNSRVDSLIPQFVEIGDNFMSAPGSIILAHDASLFVHTGSYRCQRTIIGNNVFLGANAVVLPGVRIGDGAIVGAGAIVTKDIEPYSVVAGNPARRICTVAEYVEKCRGRDCLYDAPSSFQRVWRNERCSVEDISEFQANVLAQETRRSESRRR